MNKIWSINLYLLENGRYKVRIKDDEFGKVVVGYGRTAHLAYTDATNKLIVKPWLISKKM
jgi:hypothetical protein